MPKTDSRAGARLAGRRAATARIARFAPFLGWFSPYSRGALQADFVSGLTVALILIPQSMAYAQLADLPAYFGLYAAFLPPMVAALFGSSRQLATGPVAVVSLMTSTALAPLATAGSESFIAYAIVLALLVGIFQFLLGVLRLGMVVNFLSHPVVNGFTNAAALIIATSQLSKLFGVDVDRAAHHYETVYETVVQAIHHTHWPTLGLGLLAFAIMIGMKRVNPRLPNVLVAVLVTTVISWRTGFEHNEKASLEQIRAPEIRELVAGFNQSLQDINRTMAERIEASRRLKVAERAEGTHSLAAIEQHAEWAKLEVTVEKLKEVSARLREELRDYRLVRVDDPPQGATYYLPDDLPAGSGRAKAGWWLKVRNTPLDESALTMIGGGAVVGTIPKGLPAIAPPKFNWNILLELFPMAIIISLLGFMEAISIAKAMANRTGQRLDPNQELIGQGLANIVGSFAQGYPVSGSFSRSAVNIQAGAVTGMSSVFSSLVVLITLLFFTPLLYHLPQAVLAAIIMMAVVGLLNVSGVLHAWQAQRYDGAIAIISFVCTLTFAPHLDKGIIIGVVLSLALFLLRNMKPPTAILSKTPGGHYRNAERWDLETCQHVAVFRFSCSLIFANVNHLEDELLREVRARPELKHVLLVGNGINELDSSGEVMLSYLVSKLREKSIDVSFSGLNDHVIDVMKRTQLYAKVGEDHFYHSVHHAVASIHKDGCLLHGDQNCPLLVSLRKGSAGPADRGLPAPSVSGSTGRID
jgi:SulP family sulfate permease